jgi:hypothetical protein
MSKFGNWVRGLSLAQKLSVVVAVGNYFVFANRLYPVYQRDEYFFTILAVCIAVYFLFGEKKRSSETSKQDTNNSVIHDGTMEGKLKKVEEMHEKSLITDEERKRMRDKILDN